MVRNVVKILDTSNHLLGTGLLLNHHVATVDHILCTGKNYYIEIDDRRYPAKVIYQGRDMLIDIAMLSVEIQKDYKPDIIYPVRNDNIETRGFPQDKKYIIYPNGRSISGKVISFNFINAANEYQYRGNYITVSSDESVAKGFSGSPVFIGDAIIGLVARFHIDGKPNIFNVLPISYFLKAANGAFRELFGKTNNRFNRNIINETKKSLMNPFHFRSETISFFGRNDQINQLFQFCASEASVLWWAITGVGGIGKSRLAYEFAKSLNENIWDAIMLNDYDYEFLKIKITNIKKNTFVVLDYVQQNMRDIGKWLYELSIDKFDYKIRIVLLERFGSSFKTSKWIERLNEKNCEHDALVNICYNPTMQLDPPFLVLRSLAKEDLISIAQSYYSYNKNSVIDELTIRHILERLSSLDPEFNRPLYLIFLIDAWIDNEHLSKWNKLFILESVLTRELHRIKLILKNVLDDDLLISAYLNVLIYSTIMDGLKFPEDIEIICSENLSIFQDSMNYHRKDIIGLFQQIGFLTKDNEGNYLFEGLKPDLLGEYYVVNSYTNCNEIEKLIRQSMAFPKKALSFYHRLLDDYCEDIESPFRSLLINSDTSSMSNEQISYFGQFLCERIIRDNRKNSEICLARLSNLYAKNSNKEIAIIYACGLSNMIAELNLKKSRELLTDLENLYYTYDDSLEIAIEYAYALEHIIERKSNDASKRDFENLTRLYAVKDFNNNLDINLCYAKALKQLSSKEVDSHLAWEFCKELKYIFQKFSTKDEFVYIYASCLSSFDITFYNKDIVLLELSSLCEADIVRPIFAQYIVNNYKSGFLSKETALYWLNNEYDFTGYVNLLEKYSDDLTDEENGENRKDIKSEIEVQLEADQDINRAKKLVWLSNRLNYNQCKDIVQELKAIYIKYSNSFDFAEYYLISLLTLSKHLNQGFEKPYELLKSILELSNNFFYNLNEAIRLSIYESISTFAKHDLFPDRIKYLFNTFLKKVLKVIRPEEEIGKIIAMLTLTGDDKIDPSVDEYFENMLLNYYQSELIQRQYIKLLNKRNISDLKYIFEKIPLFYEHNCLIIVDYFAQRILKLFSMASSKKIMSYISDFLTNNKSEIIANVYSKLILKRFLEDPKPGYYELLSHLESEYSPNPSIALDCAQLLFHLNKERLIDIDELQKKFRKLVKKYCNERIALIYQRALTCIIADANSIDKVMEYINEQKGMLNDYGTLEFAVEYCNSLSLAGKFFSESENLTNFLAIKDLVAHFHNREAFNPFLKIIISHIRVLKIINSEKAASENEILDRLKKKIRRLYLQKNDAEPKKVSLVVEEARKCYQKFSNIGFAIQLCQVLALLSQFVSCESLTDIVKEVEAIYNQYPSNSLLSKYYYRILNHAIKKNCDSIAGQLNEIEETLVHEIKENPRCAAEIYTTLSSILHLKNSKNESNQLIDIELDKIVIPAAYSYTKPAKTKIDAILYHYHIWGTLDKPVEIIVIESQNILVDGYARWVVANDNNMNFLTARVLAKY